MDTTQVALSRTDAVVRRENPEGSRTFEVLVKCQPRMVSVDGSEFGHEKKAAAGSQSWRVLLKSRVQSTGADLTHPNHAAVQTGLRSAVTCSCSAGSTGARVVFKVTSIRASR